MDAISTPGETGEPLDSAQTPTGRTPSALGVRLKERRIAAAMSQHALSRASGVERSTITKLESGAYGSTDPDTIVALAKALDCPPADLCPPSELLGSAFFGPETAPAAPPAGEVMIPRIRIRPSPLNPRRLFDEKALADLAASLVAAGQLQNLLVRPDPENAGDYLLISGERRWRAAGINIERGVWPADHALRCMVMDVDDVQHRLLAITENLQRVDVAPMDEAETYREMIALGDWDTARIAAHIGKTPRHVQLRLALLTRLDEQVQAALRDKDIQLAHARALTAAPAALQRLLFDRMMRGDPSLRRAEDIAAQIRAATFPASRALFPLDAYQGERADDAVTGETLLLDAEKAKELQVAAIKDRVAELQTRYAWVEIKEHNDFWTPGGADRIVPLADRPPGDDVGPDGIGAVVRIDGYLTVTIFEPLIILPQPAAPPAHTEEPAPAQPSTARETMASRPDPIAAVSPERRLYALQAKTRALQAAMLVHPDAWLHQLALALMGCQAVADIVAAPPRPENAVVAPEVAAVLQRYRTQLGGDEVFLPMSAEWPYLSLARSGSNAYSTSVEASALTVLPRLQAMGVDALSHLLAALTASRCGTRHLPMRLNLGDDPLVLATVASIGADVALSPQPLDAAYLETLTADQLERLAADTGACTDVEEFSALTRKGQYTLILDHMAANDVRHIPPEMRFADVTTTLDALRAEAEGEAEETPACCITGLPDTVDEGTVARLARAAAQLPEFGRLGLSLEARGATLSLLKQTHGETPETYSAEAFDDGFKRLAITDAKPSHIASFVRIWLDEHSSQESAQ